MNTKSTRITYQDVTYILLRWDKPSHETLEYVATRFDGNRSFAKRWITKAGKYLWPRYRKDWRIFLLMNGVTIDRPYLGDPHSPLMNYDLN